MGWMFIGNTIVNRRGGGISWQTYWSSLISATVEDAAPTNVVLTFPSAKPTLGASDFTIAGFTISSASWAGSVLTLVTSVAVTAYRGNFLITFVQTGTTATVTNNVAIADTVGWYASGDGSATYVTKDGSDAVSVWKDLSGANHPLNQAKGTNQPLWTANGIITDGIDNWMKTANFTYNQPVFVYLVINQITWGALNYIFDGLNDAVILYAAGGLSSPQMKVYAGIASDIITDLTLNTLHIVRVKYNGATSKYQTDNNAAITGNFGANNMGAITIGSKGDGLGVTCANVLYKEMIFRNSADDAATETAIYNYLANKYGFATI